MRKWGFSTIKDIEKRKISNNLEFYIRLILEKIFNPSPFSFFSLVPNRPRRRFSNLELGLRFETDHPEWSLLSYLEFRWGDNASKLYRTSLLLEAIYQPCPWLGLAPGYRQVWLRVPLNSDHWRPEYTPLADIYFFLTPSDWEITNRNRIEYRILENDPIRWVYRNRIRIVPPWNFTSLEITPFIENEIFIRESRGLRCCR